MFLYWMTPANCFKKLSLYYLHLALNEFSRKYSFPGVFIGLQQRTRKDCDGPLNCEVVGPFSGNIWDEILLGLDRIVCILKIYVVREK